MTPRDKILNELAIIAHEHKLSLRDILSPARYAHIVACRNHAMWYVRNKYGYSLPKIGRLFNRHHATVYHGIAAYEFTLGIENERTIAHLKKLEDSRDRIRARAGIASA